MRLLTSPAGDAGIEACKSAGLPFQIHTTVVDWNRGEICDIADFAQEIGAVNHSVFFLVPVRRGKFIKEAGLEVLENKRLLQDIMRKSADVDIDVKVTCAPQFTRVADQLGIPTRYTRGCLAGLTYCVVGNEGIVRYGRSSDTTTAVSSQWARTGWLTRMSVRLACPHAVLTVRNPRRYRAVAAWQTPSSSTSS